MQITNEQLKALELAHDEVKMDTEKALWLLQKPDSISDYQQEVISSLGKALDTLTAAIEALKEEK